MTDESVRSRDLFTVIRERSSVRSFRSDPVPLDLVRQAIEAAGWAPSPHGTQPWRFAVLASQESRRRLSEAMAEVWRGQLRLDGTPEEVVEHRLARSRERLETAPVVVVLCLYLGDAHTYPDIERQDAEVTMAVQSLGAAAQNFLLALHSLGLDAGWMCAPLFNPETVRQTLGLDPALIP
ncbi:MAG TPA: nitroreductase family protein, partial [Thermomicrobiales bacterium]|nr:nitroreductase family protein [Thermomicrobiales bacterium]